jgi:hypothetical protein
VTPFPRTLTSVYLGLADTEEYYEVTKGQMCQHT